MPLQRGFDCNHACRDRIHSLADTVRHVRTASGAGYGARSCAASSREDNLDASGAGAAGGAGGSLTRLRRCAAARDRRGGHHDRRTFAARSRHAHRQRGEADRGDAGVAARRGRQDPARRSHNGLCRRHSRRRRDHAAHARHAQERLVQSDRGSGVSQADQCGAGGRAFVLRHHRRGARQHDFGFAGDGVFLFERQYGAAGTHRRDGDGRSAFRARRSTHPSAARNRDACHPDDGGASRS